MLSSSMKEGTSGTIEFPGKDPNEWKVLYEFITPQKMRMATHNPELNRENLLALLTWFHEFQMVYHVKECDEFLAKNYFSEVLATNAD